MEVAFSELNWIAIIVAVVVGQVLLTLWFTLLFGEPWAKAYGADSRTAHAKDVPASAYGIGLACMIALVITTALLHQAAGVTDLAGGLTFGLIGAAGYGLATVLPGYGFLLRSAAGRIAAGSQASAILTVSLVLGVIG